MLVTPMEKVSDTGYAKLIVLEQSGSCLRAQFGSEVIVQSFL